MNADLDASPETDMADLDALKREHNKVYLEGVDLLKALKVAADRVEVLRDRIQKIEVDSYDGIRLLFCGTFDLGGEDD